MAADMRSAGVALTVLSRANTRGRGLQRLQRRFVAETIHRHTGSASRRGQRAAAGHGDLRGRTADEPLSP